MNDILRSMLKEYLKCDDTNVTIEYQKDGLTNQNYMVSKDNMKYVIRISGENSLDLGINRYAELAAMKAVSTIDVGSEIIYFSTDTGNMITKFIEGKKWSIEDTATTENMVRIAATMKKVHSLPHIPYEFSPYKDIQKRIQLAIEKKYELPDYLNRLLDKLFSIEKYRKKYGEEFIGLCHNDPFPNNFIDNGSVKLIDWEYAGMGDIFYDLASICTFYSPSKKEEFLKYYFGQIDSDKLESLDQMAFVSTFWNCMWAVIQSGLPDAKHDFKTMSKNMFINMKEML